MAEGSESGASPREAPLFGKRGPVSVYDVPSTTAWEATVTEEKKGSIFGFLKNALTEEVPDEPAKAHAAAPPAKGTAPAHQTPAVHVAASAVEADPAALAKLDNRLQASLPPVYASFMEQYGALQDVIPDETVRFKAALKTSHANADAIIAALDQLLSSMEQAHSDFLHSFEASKGKILGDLQQSIDATADLIKTREQQVQAIQAEIASLQAKREHDSARSQSESSRLEETRSGFEAALAQVVGRLTAQKTASLRCQRDERHGR